MRFIAVVLCALVVLAGCGNGSTDEDGHRFATETRPPTEATDSPTTEPTTPLALPTAVPTRTAEEVTIVRGAPQFAYFEVDAELVVYDANSRQFTPINLPDELSMLDYAASPTGDRVGILGLLDEKVVVQFYGADGEPLGDAIRLSVTYTPNPPSASWITGPAATPQSGATPVAEGSFQPLNLSWVPQGNAVVVSGPGVLQRVSMSGQIMPLSRAGINGAVVEAFWSPMDSQVTILTLQMNGHQAVFVLDSGSAEAKELDRLHLQPGQAIDDVQWLPSGTGLVFVAGTSSQGDLMNGQLYVYRFGDEVPTLVATSGQGGPAGTISHAAVSPDGTSVAYAIMVRDQGEWHLHSLWIRPISGGTGFSIPVNSNAPITEMRWTTEGLVWQQEDGSILVVDGGLEPRPLGEEPAATPITTPVVEVTPRG